jgi:type IV pilus assembly protein PilO
VLLLSGAHDELTAERNKEPALKQDYRAKLGQAVNLGELRKQKLQVEEYVTQLEKQLPGKAEMDALLSDINQAGLGRGLQFELFRPGQVVVKDYYAELPIAIRVSGRYHDLGSFTADIANLSRIVTLHNLSIVGARDVQTTGQLSMDATARTYRYLDASELDEIKRAAAARNKPGAKK